MAVRASDAPIAAAKLHVCQVHSIGINNGEISNLVIRNGARVTIMTKKNSDAEKFELNVCEMITRPILSRTVRQSITAVIIATHQGTVEGQVRVQLDKTLPAPKPKPKTIFAFIQAFFTTLSATTFHPSAAFMTNHFIQVDVPMILSPFM